MYVLTLLGKGFLHNKPQIGLFFSLIFIMPLQVVIIGQMLFLLFSSFCHCDIERIFPGVCEPMRMPPKFPCDINVCNNSNIISNCNQRQLTNVPSGIPGNVTVLDLSKNDIYNITAESFSNLFNLTILNLNFLNYRKNKDRVIINSMAFKNLTKLTALKLVKTNLTDIPTNLPPNVRKLDLSNNNIMLQTMNLSSLANITHLWLTKNCYSWNPCKSSVTVENNTFAVMTKLRILDLTYNNLTAVPKGLPQSLEELSLGFNQIAHIFQDDFLGLKNLQALKFQGNCPRCENAPFPCVPCKNSSLDIHPLAFRSLTQLERLHLGGNSLRRLDSSWFQNLTKLKVLYLSFNLLEKAITEDAPCLQYLPQLKKLDISFNYEPKTYSKTVKLSRDFSHLHSLQILQMAALVFQEIGPETLSSLYGLKNLSALNLGTNFIINFNSSVFSNFPQTKMIYLAENRLYPMQVNKTQPFNGNNQLSVFSPPPVLNPHERTINYEIAHHLIKPECYQAGRVLILSSNNLFFISPEQFQGYGNIACLNLSANGFSAALNGTEFSSLPNLTYLDLSYNKIDLVYDNAFKELQKLEVLDLSYNSHYFKSYGITHNLHFIQNLPVLRVLNMSHNSISTLTTKMLKSNSLSELRFTNNDLGSLWKDKEVRYIQLFAYLTNLTLLDISNNRLTRIPDCVYQLLPSQLTKLYIQHNSLADFKWNELKHLPRLQILDLSHNSLSFLINLNSNMSQTLTFLDLSNNQIVHLDEGLINGLKSLRGLRLSYNKLTIINESTFVSGPENPLQTLFLDGNPFQCTCDSLDFFLWIGKSDIKIPRLTYEVKCDSPANQKGQALIYFDVNQCVNDSKARLMYILSSSFIIAFMFVTTVAHLFYWDASYVIHYLKAKMKGYRSLYSSDSFYEVFVTYDTTDPHVSEWVMRNLRVKLEDEGEKHLPLCLEERDWTPGIPLVDNLSHSIRYSRKTLFVLTKDYVKTGVFKLAIYLAHQRLLDENVDVIVLLMLEPVLQHSHFLRLRRRLYEKSVIEWPKTAAAQPWFWQNLRNVVRVDNRFVCNKTYSKYFSSR